MSNPEKKLAAYDNALLGILQNEGKLEAFLDVMFGFLCRRTDFFLLMKDEASKYGFPPGVAEKMVVSYFKKYQKLVLEAQVQQAAKSPADKTSLNTRPKTDAPDEAKTKEVASADTKPLTATPQSNGSAPSEAPVCDSSEEPPKEAVNTNVNEQSAEPSTTEAKDKQSVFQSNPDSYNGAMRDNYCWSQNYDDVDVKIPVEKCVTRAKQLQIEIERKHLKVLVKKDEKSSEFETIIDDDLQHEINREESMWSLESGKHVNITLTKDKNIWWSMLLKSEEEIDIQKIAPERSMTDMDEEERAVINKLQFDDRQKKLGLPQSHELKVHEMLKKGWDAEGSPFQGQSFDPKMFNVSPGAVDM